MNNLTELTEKRSTYSDFIIGTKEFYCTYSIIVMMMRLGLVTIDDYSKDAQQDLVRYIIRYSRSITNV